VRIAALALFALGAIAFALGTIAQDYHPPDNRLPTEFYFARLEYPGLRDTTYIKNWYTDYPLADNHFAVLVNRLTGIRTDIIRVYIDSDTIFEYPFVYIVEPAQANLTDEHIVRLRKYLARGGFLMLDDIHGNEDMIPVLNLLAHIFPGTDPTKPTDTLVELDISHEIFHVFYDIPVVVQVLNDALAMCTSCAKWENGETGEIPQVFAHYNDDGYIDMLIMYNNDIGDSAEWLDDPRYPREMSLFGIKMMVNSILYAMSH